MNKNIIEVLTAVPTAFDIKGDPDNASNTRLYEHLIKGGSDGIVLTGSTGEFYSLTVKMAEEIADNALKAIHGRMKVYIGTSRLIPEETIYLSNKFLSNGADGVMIISPFYFPLSDQSIENYYDQIVPNINGPVYLYNFPGCTGYDLKPEIALRLRRKYSNISGYKDTITTFGHTRELIETILPEFPDFRVFSGLDEFFAHNVLAGGSGLVGGMPNLAPEIFTRWKQEVLSGDFTAIQNTQKIVNKMMVFFDICKPFVTSIKYALKMKGIIDSDTSRSGMVSATPEEAEKIEQVMRELNL